jgi:hypothetical protein
LLARELKTLSVQSAQQQAAAIRRRLPANGVLQYRINAHIQGVFALFGASLSMVGRRLRGVFADTSEGGVISRLSTGNRPFRQSKSIGLVRNSTAH